MVWITIFHCWVPIISYKPEIRFHDYWNASQHLFVEDMRISILIQRTIDYCQWVMIIIWYRKTPYWAPPNQIFAVNFPFPQNSLSKLQRKKKKAVYCYSRWLSCWGDWVAEFWVVSCQLSSHLYPLSVSHHASWMQYRIQNTDYPR